PHQSRLAWHYPSKSSSLPARMPARLLRRAPRNWKPLPGGPHAVPCGPKRRVQTFCWCLRDAWLVFSLRRMHRGNARRAIRATTILLRPKNELEELRHNRVECLVYSLGTQEQPKQRIHTRCASDRCPGKETHRSSRNKGRDNQGDAYEDAHDRQTRGPQTQ